MKHDLHSISTLRLHHQHLLEASFNSPKDIVAHLGAMQSQDYDMSKWGIALRMKNPSDQIIEEAIDQAEIIRSHILRPTWHLVARDDYRWMLELSAPQLRRNAASYNKQVGLEERTIQKSLKLIEQLLAGHQYLTRDEIMSALNKHKIKTNDLNSTHIMFNAELNGLVCNGPRRGKQWTYALLDERIPASKSMTRDEALARLASIYFTSHAPASDRDFSWWSGLNLGDARKAINFIEHRLNSVTVNEIIYYFTQEELVHGRYKNNVILLPAFDEFLVSYADRTPSLAPERTRDAITVNGIFKPVIVHEGKVIGLWKRTVKPKHIEMELFPFTDISLATKKSIEKSASQLSAFLNKPLKMN